jgi:hypothetical protein
VHLGEEEFRTSAFILNLGRRNEILERKSKSHILIKKQNRSAERKKKNMYRECKC